jgi:YHS domain-containing protein
MKMCVRRAVRLIGGVFVVLVMALGAWAADSPKLAIKGYDPVAYFTDGRAVVGKPEFKQVWQGSLYQFASPQHRDQFAADPERYAPQFGGFCALGVAKGMKAEVDPEAWTIVNGKLYLNYDQAFRDQWRADAATNIAKAEKNWKTMKP